ncbi:MAG: hypothetical protein GY953_02220, partial [bacterium]|nr:hypothetical protein [bacterium]
MRIRTLLLILCCLNLPGAEPGLRGFRAEAVSSQRELETRAMAIPEPARAREYLERMAAEPH